EVQLFGHGADTQERLCREVADIHGLQVVQLALEVGSAASMSKRRTWRQVQRAALRHEFDALIVWEYSRISRNTADWLELISRALCVGVEVLSADKQEVAIDWYSPMGRAMLAMIGSVNEMEREKLRQRVMQGTRTRALKGMPLVGGKAPFGYHWVEEPAANTI